MFFITSSKIEFKLKYYKLSEKPDLLDQAAEWGEKEWGYLRHFPGIEKRKELIKNMQDDFYVVIYGKQLVGMFALINKEPLDKLLLQKNPSLKIKKLTYFYVREELRSIGIGAAMLKYAKKIATNQKATIIVLDTLKPRLNKFYEKSGAKVLCEDKSLDAPTTLLRI